MRANRACGLTGSAAAVRSGECFYPLLQQLFPEQLGTIAPDNFYAAINRAKPSLIRVEADELTYNLHIMVRFEIEQDVIEGRTRAEDLPKVWNDKMQSYLGIVPPNDAEGVLQDVHWSFGAFGYFPTYTLGNLYAAHLYDQAHRDIQDLDAKIEAGRLTVNGSIRRFTGGAVCSPPSI